MTKQELTTKIADNTGIAKTVVVNVIEEATEVIAQALEDDETLFIRGFGAIGNKQRAAKKGRNISKKCSVDIPARKKPFFKPYRDLMRRVNN